VGVKLLIKRFYVFSYEIATSTNLPLLFNLFLWMTFKLLFYVELIRKIVFAVLQIPPRKSVASYRFFLNLLYLWRLLLKYGHLYCFLCSIRSQFTLVMFGIRNSYSIKKMNNFN
jgi:hypothetical protein